MRWMHTYVRIQYIHARIHNTHTHTHTHTQIKNIIFPTAEQFVALYDYKPQSDDDLELKENDIVTLLEKADNEEWYHGQVGERKGWFPAKYVQPINGSESSETKKTMKEGWALFRNHFSWYNVNLYTQGT